MCVKYVGAMRCATPKINKPQWRCMGLRAVTAWRYSGRTQRGSLGLSMGLYLHQGASNKYVAESCIRQVRSEVVGVSAKTCQHAKRGKREVKVK
jgi:hypothetical protein